MSASQAFAGVLLAGAGMVSAFAQTPSQAEMDQMVRDAQSEAMKAAAPAMQGIAKQGMESSARGYATLVRTADDKKQPCSTLEGMFSRQATAVETTEKQLAPFGLNLDAIKLEARLPEAKMKAEEALLKRGCAVPSATLKAGG